MSGSTTAGAETANVTRGLKDAIPESLLQRLEALGASVDVLARLAATHRRLWSLEDGARSTHSSAEQIADIKRQIDHANGERHGLIDELDATVDARSREAEPVRRSETTGELCDRLIILGLKLSSAVQLAADDTLPGDRRALCEEKLRGLANWRDHLLLCLGDQLGDIEAGRAALPPRSEFKMYNDPLLNPVTREESRLEAGAPSEG
jgi:hypothetical protein